MRVPNELGLFKVNYNDDRITLSARELHEFLEINTQYTKWFERMAEYGFNENTDYQAISQKRLTAQGNETTYTDHQITIDMAKEIAMLQRNDKGKQARQYFIELEKKWNSPECVMNRALEYSRKQVQQLLQEKKEMQPKVLFADAVATSNTSILIGELAKLIKQNGRDIGQNRLFDELRNDGYLIKHGSSRNAPTQKAMNLGLFEVKETTVNNPNGSIRITKTTKVTGKGQIYFINRYCNEKENKDYSDIC